MKKLTGIVMTLLLGVTLALGSISGAEAARLGGGKSFGSKSTFSSPYRRSVTPPQKSFSQQQAQSKNQAVRESLAKRGGLMGMLGGLALGGLLGALLFGGAFEGLNFLDIAMFALIAFMLYKLFAAKRAGPVHPAYGAARNRHDERDTPFARGREEFQGQPSRAGFDTDLLFDKNKPAGAGDADFDAEPDYNRAVVPANFDEAAFLRGAKAAYEQLQAAWDSHDLAEIRGLTTDKVFAELQDQLRAGDGENRTELLKVEAELLEVREVGADLEAAVLFDVIMREEADQRPAQVREVWHFVRPVNSRQPTWYLDGIQQLED